MTVVYQTKHANGFVNPLLLSRNLHAKLKIPVWMPSLTQGWKGFVLMYPGKAGIVQLTIPRVYHFVLSMKMISQ